MDQIGKQMPGGLSGVSNALSIYGDLNKANIYQSMGNQSISAGNIESAQQETNANNALASSQRAAYEQNRQGTIDASRALAVAAASGGGASDPTVVNLMARMAGESHYKSMTDIYQGQSQAQALQYGAAVSRYSGQVANYDASQAASASRFSALTTAIQSPLVSSLYKKFGQNKPGAPSGAVVDPNAFDRTLN